MNRKQEIQRLYNLILGREADQGGLNHYLNSKMSLYDIQAALWQSNEFKNRFNHINPIETSIVDYDIPIFVINLERRPDRKAQAQSRLNNLGINNYTLTNAVDGSKLTVDQIANDYDDVRSKEIHRSMTPSEIACALSHIECAKKILNDDLQYAIILEDDVELTLDFKKFLKEFDINKNYGFDFLILGAFSSNQFFNGKLKTKQSPNILVEKESIIYLDEKEQDIGDVSIHESFYPTKQLDYVHGTHAYVMSKAGAEKLLKLNYPVIVEADNMWNYFPDSCDIKFTKPILCHRQHLDSDIHTGRINIVANDNNFSDNFIQRKSHQDFGT